MNAIEKFISEAASILGEQAVLSAAGDIRQFSHDEAANEAFSRMPAAVVKPGTEEEVAEIVQLCSRLDVPVTPRGGGTGLAAGCVPASDGIVLSLERLNKIIDVDRSNMTITVQSGVPLKTIYEKVEEAGLFFPPHPGDEGAMAGGVVASNAGGARAVKYGTIKQFVRGLKVVTADGTILNLGGKIIKSSSGYHLMDLMIGSEGTLGVITEATFSLLPSPGSVKTVVIPFSSYENALGASLAVFTSGIIPFALEYMESRVIAFSEKLLNKTWPAKHGEATLLLILDGPGEDEVLSLAEKTSLAIEPFDPLDILLAEQKEKQAEILEIRSMIYEALRPGTGDLFDISLPRTEIAGHLKLIRELEETFGVPLPTIGHTGDGNIHTSSMRVTLQDGVFGSPIEGWSEKNSRIEEKL